MRPKAILGEVYFVYPLAHILREYEHFFNHARPHQGIKQQIPSAQNHPMANGRVARRDIPGGIIHDDYRVA